MSRYDEAKKIYAEFGVDTEAAMERLSKLSVSVHCWQGDDVIGFDGSDSLSGGIQTTGNYPGRARNPEELFADLTTAFKLMPGKKRVNVHACYAIIGKSGSGKTTLLSLMAGLDLPTEGEIIVDGKSTKEWNRNQMRRDAVSVIYQNYNLFPLLTVQENIQYPLDLKKMPRKKAVAMVKEVRERVELPATYDKRLPSHLSGGEQQRVAIARALAQGCKIILADEPTGNLDSTNTRNIVEVLRSLAHEDGCTVIIVTHDPAVAEQADVVLQMKDGSWI
jgi:putative ABC transport system ATP-binding protein